MTTWRLLDSGAMSPSLNMAVDQAILGLHANGKSPPTLRFYQWTPPAVSLGYCQKQHNLDMAACRRLGIEVVRRPSGGRAVLHLGDLTYAVIAGTADGMPSAVTAAYRLIMRRPVARLPSAGDRCQSWAAAIIKPPQMDICFLRGTLGSIVYQERKFVGSAQTWHASSMLQHGSIILAPQIETLVSLWPGIADSPEARQAKLESRITSLQEIMGRLPEVEEVKTAIREGLARTLGIRFDQGELTPGEWTLAKDYGKSGGRKGAMPDEDITQISLGRFRVGITGLKAAIEEAKSWRERPEEEIAQALLAAVKPRNYIPASAQEEYKRAFLREFKKALGEKVEEERSGLSIKILGPGCPSCDRLEQTVMAVLGELGLPGEVEHVRDMKEITALGVFGTPALMINDEVKAVGAVPTKEMLKKWLAEANHQKK